MIGHKSSDYSYFLEKWFNSLKDDGGISGLKTFSGNYNYPYVTILALLTYLPINALISIKTVSILFDFAQVIIGVLIIKTTLKDKFTSKLSLLAYAILLFLPTVVLNGASWSQCDSIYTTFILLSVLMLLKNKIITSFISLGVAFAFKLQFMFILPLFVLLFFTDKNRRISILHFFIIPVVNIVLCLPALISGVPFKGILTMYFNQTQTYGNKLVMNFPNFYELFPNITSDFYLAGVIVAFLLFAILLLYFIVKKVKWSNELLLSVGLFSILLATYFLPGMHDRYLYAADILSVIWFICYHKKIFIPIVVNLVSINTYVSYLGNREPLIDYFWLSLLFLIAVVLLFNHIRKIINKSEHLEK